MRSTRVVVPLLVAGVAAGFAASMWRASPVAAEQERNRKIAMRDDCDPDDPAWAPTGGCTLRDGDVNLAEFGTELFSPLSAAVIGHQAWRNEPSYLKIETDQDVRVNNAGGRIHTFTEVANFGGGRVPPLNMGLAPAPECASATDIAPGERVVITDLEAGNHRFQCCIHPWMRAIVKVKPDE